MTDDFNKEEKTLNQIEEQNTNTSAPANDNFDDETSKHYNELVEYFKKQQEETPDYKDLTPAEFYIALEKDSLNTAKTKLLYELMISYEYNAVAGTPGYRSDLKGDNDTTLKAQIREKYNLSAKQATLISHLTREGVKQAVDEAAEKNEPVTRNRAINIIKEQIKTEKSAATYKNLTRTAPSIIDDGKRFDVLYGDIYKENISAEGLEKTSIPSAKDAVLLMWAQSKDLAKLIKVMATWGFDYKDNLVFEIKKATTGQVFSAKHQILLVGAKGDYKFKPEISQNSFHSEVKLSGLEKTDYFSDIIETMYPEGAYFNIFSHKKHNEKWAVGAEPANDNTIINNTKEMEV